MKKYKVNAGHTVHENGTIYSEGDEFYTTPHRAIELGLGEKITEVEELTILESQNEGISKLMSDLEKAQATITELQGELEMKSADLEKAQATITELQGELEMKSADLEKAQATITELQGELEKAKNKKNNSINKTPITNMKTIILALILFVSSLTAYGGDKPVITEWSGVPAITSLLDMPEVPVISNQQINNIAGESGTGVLSAGDTTVAIDIANANRFIFAFKDLSLSGADSLKAFIRFKSGGVTFYAPLAVHDLGQVTSTTNTLIMSPGDGLAGAYVFSLAPFAGSNQLFSGTIYIQRTNTRTGEAVYAAKTRYSWNYD